MTVGRLKELLRNVPNNVEIRLHDAYQGEDLISVSHLLGRNSNNQIVVMETRNDFDVQEELKARFFDAFVNNDNEWDFYWELVSDGYKLEDFEGMQEYEWLKHFVDEHDLDDMY